MSQVNKIEHILGNLVLPNYSKLNAVGEKRVQEGKQALLSAILEVKPSVSKSPFAHPEFNAAYKQGYQKALDEWEQAIKELFG